MGSTATARRDDPRIQIQNNISGYCVFDDDFSKKQFGGGGGATACPLKVTAAHEFNHAIQFNYDAFEDMWFLEATADEYGRRTSTRRSTTTTSTSARARSAKPTPGTSDRPLGSRTGLPVRLLDLLPLPRRVLHRPDGPISTRPPIQPRLRARDLDRTRRPSRARSTAPSTRPRRSRPSSTITARPSAGLPAVRRRERRAGRLVQGRRPVQGTQACAVLRGQRRQRLRRSADLAMTHMSNNYWFFKPGTSQDPSTSARTSPRRRTSPRATRCPSTRRPIVQQKIPLDMNGDGSLPVPRITFDSTVEGRRRGHEREHALQRRRRDFQPPRSSRAPAKPQDDSSDEGLPARHCRALAARALDGRRCGVLDRRVELDLGLPDAHAHAQRRSAPRASATPRRAPRSG